MICSKEFFGGTMPQIEISKRAIESLARESVSRGLTVPGVQKKLSLNLTSNDTSSRLTLVGYPSGYILKPQTVEYPYLPESEDMVMDMAEIVGIKVVPHGLIKLDEGKEYAYITKRIDREFKDNSYLMYAMEDFCQLSGRLTSDKYRGSYEQCAKIINKYSMIPGLDLSELYLRLVFSFIIGNSDMHLKNFSLIERTSKSRQFILSPAYDLLNVNIVNPNDTEEMALALNGKKSRLTRNDFLSFANSIDVPIKSAEKLIKKVVSNKEKLVEICKNSYISKELKEKTIALINQRIDRIKQ